MDKNIVQLNESQWYLDFRGQIIFSLISLKISVSAQNRSPYVIP